MAAGTEIPIDHDRARGDYSEWQMKKQMDPSEFTDIDKGGIPEFKIEPESGTSPVPLTALPPWCLAPRTNCLEPI